MSVAVRLLVLFAVLGLNSLMVLGCDRSPMADETAPPTAQAPDSGDHSASPESVEPSASTEVAVVVFLGDSLTAGYGLAEEQAFPARVAELLAEGGTPIKAVNAGVSGDTSAGGLRRLDWLMRQDPDLMVVGLGANDGLRGQPPEVTEENLEQIIEHLQAAEVEVLLLGMKIPPSYGSSYFDQFEAIYPRLAARYEVDLVPFLLADVAAQPELNLADGIHPNAEGHRRVAATVAPYVEAILESARKKTAG